jgi:hypothetical protein
MEAIHVAATPAELYSAVLVDTPLCKVLARVWNFEFHKTFKEHYEKINEALSTSR